MTEIQRREIDFLGLAELNTNWKKLPKNLQLRERTRGWFDALNINYAYNTKIPCNSSFQRGGTASFITGKLVSHIVESKIDNRGLGRWCITRLRGRNNTVVSVITAYRPVPSNEPGSTYIQQQLVLGTQGILVDPRTQFFSDLRPIIEHIIQNGEQLILMIDINGDIRAGEALEFAETLDLVEILTHMHGAQGPSTMIRNTRGIPIDGIYITRGLLGNTRGGYLDFGEGVIGSDHRALWLDVPAQLIFGGTSSLPISHRIRRLQCHHPEVVKKFVTHLNRSLDNIRFDERVNEICHNRDILHSRLLYDQLTTEHLVACQQAELRCRKLKMGAIPYSPELTRAILSITLWKKMIIRLSGGKSSLRYINRLARQSGHAINLQLTLDEVKELLDTAYKDYYKQIKPNGQELRSSFFQRKIMEADSEGNIKLAQHYRRFLDIENNRAMNRKLNGMCRVQASKIQYISGLNRQGVMITADNQADMEEVMVLENKSRFTQSKRTPFLNEPLLSYVGPLAQGRGAYEIVQGRFSCPGEFDIETRTFVQRLAHIQYDEEYNFVDELCSMSIGSGWRKMGEKISTSPFGLHVGHLKAIFTSSKANSHQLWSLLPVLKGFAPASFCKASNLFLEKKQGVREVTSLRTIVLYDAIYNMNNKIIAKVVMKRAEEVNALAPEQYGSRNEKSSSLQTLNKRLLFDSIRQSKIATIVIGNDMKSAYDRIVHAPAILSLKRLGIPEAVTHAMFAPLQLMNHHVRTIFGDSELSFHSEDEIFHGIGQGNGAGPMIWSVLSSVIFDAYRTIHGSGINLPQFEGYGIPELAGLAFVDDVDLVIMAKRGMSVIELIHDSQRKLDSYEKLIKLTGGAINPSKSYSYYLVPDGCDRPFVTGDTLTSWQIPFLSCKDHQDNVAGLPNISADQAQRTLGAYIAPNGNQDEQIQQLTRISKEWANRIRTNQLSKREILYAVSTRYFKQVEYPLLCSSLTRNQCDQITSPMFNAILPKIGFVRSFPRVIVHGPLRYQGLQIKSLFSQGIIVQLSTLLEAMHSDSITSQMLRWTMRCTVHESGFQGPIHRIPDIILEKCCTNTWVIHLLLQLRTYNIVLEDDIINSSIKREDDFHLMELCYNRQFSITELQAINQCRLYLGVTLASDLLSGCGKHVLEWAWDGTRSMSSPFRSLEYPRPKEKRWVIWRRMLRQIFGCGRNQQIPLDSRIGRWKIPRTTTDWYCFVQRGGYRAFVKWNDNSWSSYRLPSRFRRGFPVRLSHPRAIVPLAELPSDIYPASIHHRGHALWLSKENVFHVPMVNSGPDRPFTDTVTQIQSTAKACLPTMIIEDEGWRLAQDIREGIAWGTSDGSYSQDVATAAFCLMPSNGELSSTLKSVLMVPGHSSKLSAYRAELYGLYSTTLATYILVKAYKITTGKVTIWCDGLSAVTQCQSLRARPNGPNYDILAGIFHLIRNMPNVSIEFRHVRGHQDLTNRELTKEEVSNVEMDNHAQALRRRLIEKEVSPLLHPIPVSNFSLYSSGHHMEGELSEWIVERIHGTELRTYWVNKNRICQEDLPHIDWNALEQALSATPVHHQWKIIKFVSGFMGVGKWLNRWDRSLSSECPFCFSPNETTSHVLLCSDPRVRSNWETTIGEFKVWLEESQAPEALKVILPQILLSWRDPNIHEFPAIPEELETVIRAQSAIGWDQFLAGLLSQEWHQYLAPRFESFSTAQGKRFISALLKKLFSIAFDMWHYRNAEKHRKDNELQVREQEHIIASIRQEFAQGNPNHIPLIRRLLRKGLPRMLSTNYSSQKLWLSTIQVARSIPMNEDHQEQRSLSQMQKIFRRWMKSYEDSRLS